MQVTSVNLSPIPLGSLRKIKHCCCTAAPYIHNMLQQMRHGSVYIWERLAPRPLAVWDACVFDEDTGWERGREVAVDAGVSRRLDEIHLQNSRIQTAGGVISDIGISEGHKIPVRVDPVRESPKLCRCCGVLHFCFSSRRISLTPPSSSTHRDHPSHKHPCPSNHKPCSTCTSLQACP